MDSEPILQQSLHEIAHLLLLMYENYQFTNIKQLDCLINLCDFLQDIGLEDHICVLDVEYYRREVVSSVSDGLVSMSYETFYAWLKKISAFHYQYDTTLKNNKKSFHKLLVDYIIPASSSTGRGGVKSASLSKTCQWLRNVNIRTLDTLVESRELLKLWFLSILSQVR